MNAIQKTTHNNYLTICLVLLSFLCLVAVSYAKEIPVIAHTKVGANALADGGAPISLMAPAPHLHPPEMKVLLSRILNASLPVNENGSTAASSSVVKSLARTLSAFQPSFVSGLLHINEDSELSPYQVEAFHLIRKEVLQSNPRCKFDVVINSSKYPTISLLLEKLQEVNAKVMPEVFIMAVSLNNEVVYPSVLAKGIEYAHVHGQAVGYEGPLSMIPDGVDFIVIRTSDLEVHREEIVALRTKHHLPIMVQIPSSLHGHEEHTSESVSVISLYQERLKALTHLAEEQWPFGYHFAYPINNPIFNVHATSVPKDHSFFVTLRALMTRFN